MKKTILILLLLPSMIMLSGCSDENIEIKKYSECIEVGTCYNDGEAIKTLEYCNFMLSHGGDKDCTNLCKF